MSARAAWRLEGTGFNQVYRYTAGKMDWLANGLPVEGNLTGVYRAKDLARDDAPTCLPDEQVGEARRRVRAAGWDVCVVVNPERIVLGLLREEALESNPVSAVEQVMDPAPRTYRPNSPMENGRISVGNGLSVLTTTDGRLIGVLKLEGVTMWLE
jgi:CBS domain-containing protein